jgi:biopolymer transport protein ExbB
LTTAAGLSVAIPALIAYLYFSGRVDHLIMNLDSLGQKTADLISADGHLARHTSKDRPASRSQRRNQAA